MKRTIDRRAARTRRALHEALIALILRKGYEAITIQDIIDAADVGRSTFYAHYTGKEDLLRGGFETLRSELAGARQSASDRRDAGPLAFSLAMFEHACRYKQVYRALVGGRGGTVAVNEIRRVLADLVQDELRGAWDDKAVSRELAVEFVVSTFLTVLTWLLPRASKLTPLEADQMFRHLVIAGIGSSIGSTSRGAASSG
ncbi:MAG TPA: TetR/AcrR family transcriptional regulator [Stellaceae bacterium]